MSAFVRAALSLSLSGALLVLVLWLVCRAIGGRLGQTWRYYIWALVLLRLILPVYAPVNLVGTWLAERAYTGTGTVQPIQAAPKADLEQMGNAQNAAEAPGALINAPAPEMRTLVSPQQMVFAGWLLVAAALLLRKITGYRTFLRTVRQSGHIPERAELVQAYTQACAALQMQKPPQVLVLGAAGTPMTVGVFRPLLIVPESLGGERAYYTFLHELTHIRRRDALYKWVVELAVCLHWFNPVLYLMRREIQRYCELSCDEAVLRLLDAESIHGYGDTLLWQARENANRKKHSYSLALSEDAKRMKERLVAMGKLQKRTKAGTCAALLLSALLGGSAVLCGFAPPAGMAGTTLSAEAARQAFGAVRGLPSMDISSADTDTWMDGKDTEIFPLYKSTMGTCSFSNGYVLDIRWNVDTSKYAETRTVQGLKVSFVKSSERYADDPAVRRAVDSALAERLAKEPRDWSKVFGNENAPEIYRLTTPAIKVMAGPFTESADVLATRFYEKDMIEYYAATLEKSQQSTRTELAERAYQDDRIEYFSIAQNDFTEEQNKAFADRAAADGRADFFSVAFSALSENAEVVASYAESFYKQNRIDLFSIVLDDYEAMPQADVVSYATRAYQDDRIDFFSVLADHLTDAQQQDFARRAERDGKIEFAFMLE